MKRNKATALFDRLIEYGALFSGAEFSNTDTVQHFTRYFYNKLLGQCSSFIILYINNKSDAILIARSIIEGFALLHYSKKDPITNSSRWLKYSNIEVYRYIVDVESIRNSGMEETITKLEEYINDNCSEFLVNGKFGYSIKGKKYCNSWYHPKRITQIIDELDSVDVKIAYNIYSNWHHWSPLSRINSIGIENNEYFIKEHEGLENSILIVFFCLINSINDVINTYYINENTNKLQRFKELMKEYMK